MGFTATTDGKLYVFGGWDGVSPSAYFNDISSFDPKTNTWTTLSTPGLTPSGRWWMGFSAAPDGTIFLFGGGNGDGGNAVLLNDLYVFTPSTSTWRLILPSGALPSVRWTMGCRTTPDGALYVFGGGGYGTYLTDLWVYRPEYWTRLYPSGGGPAGTIFLGFAASPSGQLYTFGGWNGGRSNAFWRYDPIPNTWVQISSSNSPSPRDRLALTAASDGSIYLYGGGLDSGGLSEGIQRYDPTLNRWTLLAANGTSPGARNNVGFTSTPNGTIYLYGGTNSTGTVRDLYKFIPSQSRWIRCDGSGETCIECPVGTQISSDGLSCISASNACGESYSKATLNAVLSDTSRGNLCNNHNLTWTYITKNEDITVWTGGLGAWMTSEVQVWVCILERFADTCCPQSPNDKACYVYSETNGTFHFWGKSSTLKLA